MAEVSKGAAGEVIAARFLREKGYRVVVANFHSRFGEIDIIAENGQYIVFVEVKTRSEDGIMTPAEAVTASKRRKMVKTAALFLQAHADMAKRQPRFDVVEIRTDRRDPMQVLEIDHILNAIEMEGLHAAF